MKASVKWLGNAAFEAETGSGHTLVMDGPADAGGENRGPRPMEMLLLGTAGCSAFDVVHILQRGRHPVADCQVRVEAERAEQPPRCSPASTYTSRWPARGSRRRPSPGRCSSPPRSTAPPRSC